jgi:hypothetical protein
MVLKLPDSSLFTRQKYLQHGFLIFVGFFCCWPIVGPASHVCQHWCCGITFMFIIIITFFDDVEFLLFDQVSICKFHNHSLGNEISDVYCNL